MLGAVLLRNEVMTELVGILDDRSFYVPAHQALFRAFARISERGEPIDIVTTEAQLRTTSELGIVGGIEAIGKLADRYATSHNAVTHAELVHQAYRVREFATACMEIAEDAHGDVEDIHAFLDQAEQRLLQINQSHRSNRARRANELVRGTFARIAERAKSKNAITGLPTGYEDLDAITGGLQGGDLIIVAARPSMGKTALALNFVQHCAISHARHMMLAESERPPVFPALVFSMEMTNDQLIERMLCSEARLDGAKLRAGRMVEHEFRELVQAADRVNSAPIMLMDTPSLSITEIRAEARRFRANRDLFPDRGPDHKPKGIIVVDYLQLATGAKGKRYEIREQEVAEVSRGLKAVAKETSLPVVALSQLNRSVDNRSDHRPNLGDLRESGAIEQDADVIMFVYREERYATTDDEREKCKGDAEIIVGKQRNGPTGTVHLVFRGEYTRFENRTTHYG